MRIIDLEIKRYEGKFDAKEKERALEDPRK